MVEKRLSKYSSVSIFSHLPLVMAWFWSINLIIFPTWLFASSQHIVRFKLLLVIITWIIFSSAYLWIWKGKLISPEGKIFDCNLKSNLNPRFLFFLIIPFLGILNLFAAKFPLTSGDEELHARIFRTIGQGMEALVSAKFPGSPFLWHIGIIIFVVSIIALRKKLINYLYSNVGTWLYISALVFICLFSIFFWWKYFDQIVLSVFPEYEPDNLKAFIRFPPFSKFLWLPFSLYGWRSVFVLRIPSVICWIISGILMYQIVRLRNRTDLSIFPALYLLVLPGMFYYAHLVYLTTPMLMLWCIALYCYERYRLCDDRRFFILCAMSLNIGTLIRREAAFLALAIIIYWGWIKIRSKMINKDFFIDFGGIIWFGLSFNFVWSKISKLNPYASFAKLSNLFTIEKFISGINDFPFHIGPIASIVLLASIVFIFVKRRNSIYSRPLLKVSIITIGLSYIAYIHFYVVPDERMIGLFPFGRQWQTAHRFLVSWSPFIALLLAEGVGHIRSRKMRMTMGIGIGVVLLSQATFWPAPMTLPEFTSIKLRKGSEHPHLPTYEVVRYISDELAKPESVIQVSRELALSYYSDLISTKGIWYRNGGKSSRWTSEKGSLFVNDKEPSIEKLIRYCDRKGIDFIVLPLVWMKNESAGHSVTISRKVLSNKHFRVKRIFNFLDEPAILVAEYIK